MHTPRHHSRWKHPHPLFLLILACLVLVASAQRPSQNDTCHPFGDCQPCPAEALHEPFCQPFGNRRLVHCIPPSVASSQPQLAHPKGEIPAWESCGRIVVQERADFWEFVVCNLVFGGISLVVLFARSRRLQMLQARQLAARIGLVRGTGLLEG